MWKIPRSIDQFGPVMGPLKTQKRDFGSFSLSNVAVLSGKSFKNPNFVNNHPNVHCPYKSNTTSIPIHNQFCQSDISGSVTDKIQTENNINSSQGTVEGSTQIISECPVQKYPVESSPINYSRKRCKKIRKNHKKRGPNKNSKQNISRRQLSDMMEIDVEPDISSVMGCDSNETSISPKSLNLTDFIVDISQTPIKSPKTSDQVFTFISISPPSNSRMCSRERELSICESEDSFIVFDSETDDELKFSDSDDNTDLDSEESDSDSSIDDDFDSSCSVVPCKRVRFAAKEDLCEIHPMVQWSFAYKNARKGPWEEYARDRERFNKRINRTELILGPVFDKRHRENIYRDRFDDGV